jgi:pantetheine-phosphate adenylyltransferase
MCNINHDINPNITTIFLMPPRELCEVSSSMVKSLIGPEGWQSVISKFVPQPVLTKITQKFL